jgi:hypothetical protein
LAEGLSVPTAPQTQRVIDARGKEVKYSQTSVILRVHADFELVVTSGRLYAGDPAFIGADSVPLKRRAPAGRHRAELIAAEYPDGKQVPALLAIRFASATPTTWASAPDAGQDERELGTGECFCFGVDSGTACVADLDVCPHLDLEDGFLYPFSDHFNRSGYESINSRSSEGLNVIRCLAGRGAGSCGVCWGLDHQGRLAALVIDFDVIDCGIVPPA